MSVTLVVVRHGQAQSMAEAPSDYARRLTVGGRAALAEAFPRTFSLLDVPEGGVELWASVALRAQDTADEVARVIPVAERRESDTLFFQDVGSIVDEVAERLAENRDGVVVAVGHIPSVEDLSVLFGGAQLDFSPGSVAAFELDPDLHMLEMGRPAGKLLWFVRGPKVL